MGVGQVTPDKARELLDGTVPGPWLYEKDGDEYEYLIGTGDFGIITEAGTESDARLIAAAYALAHLVANLHYEYAVQNVETGKWVRECGGVLIYTSGPSAADWNTDLGETQNFEEWITDETLTAHRVVRRLATAPEVVE